MPGHPDACRHEEEIKTTDELSLTDRLNKYLLCAYLNRLNEEDLDSGESESDALEGDTVDNFDTEETFSD